MRFVKLESDISTLPKDRFGIRTETGETSLDQFDLIIVPGRAFTTGAFITFNRGYTANRCLYRGILYKPRHKYRWWCFGMILRTDPIFGETNSF